MRWLEYEFDGRVTDVRLLMAPFWPEVQVRIAPRSWHIEMRGTFRADGSLRLVEIEATEDDVDVTPVGIRPAVLTALKQWHSVGRDMAEQILRGVHERETVVDAKPAAEALRMLTYEPPAKRPKRRRGADAEALLRQVVDAYREALASGDPSPRKTVAEKYGYSSEHIGRLLSQARRPRNGQPPLLGPAQPRRAGEVREEVAADPVSRP